MSTCIPVELVLCMIPIEIEIRNAYLEPLLAGVPVHLFQLLRTDYFAMDIDLCRPQIHITLSDTQYDWKFDQKLYSRKFIKYI